MLSSSVEHIGFELSEESCGLTFEAAAKSDSGSWKCHLADTDEDEGDGIKAEGYVDVTVASKAEIVFEHNVEEVMVLGGVINLSCALIDPDIIPVPALTLFQRKNETEDPKVLVEGSEEVVQFSLSVRDEDEGSSFYCQSQQDYDNSTLYYLDFSDETPSMTIVFPPSIDDLLTNHPPFIVTDSTLDIPFVFSSRPAPEDSALTWTVLNEDGEEVVTDLAAGTYDLVADIEASSILDAREPDQYYSNLTMRNMTQNVTVMVSVENDYGSLLHTFTVTYLIPPPPPLGPDVNAAGVPWWVIVVVVIGIIFLLGIIICACCVSSRAKKSGKKGGKKKKKAVPVENAGN